MSGLVGEVNENIQVKNGQEKYDVKLGIREWKRYPEYKDSGVKWIGEIPKGWEVKPLKFASELNPEALPENTDPDYILKYIDIGNVSLGTLVSEPTEMKFCNSPSRARKIVKNGDIIISTVRTYLKAILLIRNPDPNLIVSTGFAVIRSSLFNNPKYLYYAVRSTNFIEAVMAHSEGIGYPAINTLVLGKLPILIPSSIEQQAIVNFLDCETSKIDTLIEKKQRLIELLEEKRSALINNVVTKGLDADMKMKDSGVEWIRMIPENWEMTKNGLLFNQRDERDFPDLPILQVSISKGVTLREFSKNRVEQMAEDPATYKRTKKGDIVFNKMRMWQGAIGVTPQDGLVSPDYTVAKPIETVNPRYFELQFRTDFYKTEVNRYSYGIVSDRNRLYWDGFKQIKSIYPPFEEQNIIVNFLDRETEKIDTFINKISAQIEKLKEYRTALISAAVTGKIDVREEVA